jgi:hypothetical protein
MPETAAEKRLRVARELADLERAEGDAPDPKPRRLSVKDSERRERALRGDLPLPGIEHRPHLELHQRFNHQWPPPESAAVPHQEHDEVHEAHARRWPTAHRESNVNGY